MRLVFYSGGQEPANQILHEQVVQLAMERAGRRRRLRMTYVPFCEENARVFFNRAVRRYKPFGVNDFFCFPVERPIPRRAIERALSSDIIYLAGGNTFYFLKHLRTTGMMLHLRMFAHRGGVLAGLSAGGLILSPNINLAGIPKFNADENEVGLRNLSALGLVKFEFYPHYVNSERVNRELLSYSRKTKYPIYACVDGGGLVVNGRSFSCVGSTYLFQEGRRAKIGG